MQQAKYEYKSAVMIKEKQSKMQITELNDALLNKDMNFHFGNHGGQNFQIRMSHL